MYRMMRCPILIMTLAMNVLTSNAYVSHNLGDAAEWTMGVQTTCGTREKRPGVGIHFKTQYLDSWRTGVSGNYYFKKDGVSCYDINLEGNYIFDLSDKVRLYPLAGGRLAFWHTDDVNASGWHFERDDKTHYEIGLNLGGGIDYLLGDHWGVNAEVKYQYIKKTSQVLFLVGVGYRF